MLTRVKKKKKKKRKKNLLVEVEGEEKSQGQKKKNFRAASRAITIHMGKNPVVFGTFHREWKRKNLLTRKKRKSRTQLRIANEKE